MVLQGGQLAGDKIEIVLGNLLFQLGFPDIGFRYLLKDVGVGVESFGSSNNLLSVQLIGFEQIENPIDFLITPTRQYQRDKQG